MSFAAPVVRGNFTYNGDLYVDVGNLNRHKRATVAEISGLLRPDLRKKKNAPPIKDQVGHWYEAQLIHYGLPPSKDKSIAKLRLLDNLNKSNLNVPTYVIAMESELKKKFAANERKAKAQYKKQAATGSLDSPQPVASKTRKHTNTTVNDGGVNVNIRIDMGGYNHFGMGVSLANNEVNESPRKKQTARRGNAKALTPAALARRKADDVPSTKKTNVTATSSSSAVRKTTSDAGKPRSNGDVESGSPEKKVKRKAESKVKKEEIKPKFREEVKPKVEEEVKPKMKKEPPADSEAKQIKKEPNAKAATPKKEPKIKQEFKPPTLGSHQRRVRHIL